ncbi:hypothetical protein DID96_05850 [Burkholderia sp. Bp8963]|nr:hypothetical protein DID96_05850 [Burkholderia sp. Bp8963]
MRFSTRCFSDQAGRPQAANAVSLNGFQTTRCRLQAKIITRNLEIFGDVSEWNIEPEPILEGTERRQ